MCVCIECQLSEVSVQSSSNRDYLAFFVVAVVVLVAVCSTVCDRKSRRETRCGRH